MINEKKLLEHLEQEMDFRKGVVQNCEYSEGANRAIMVVEEYIYKHKERMINEKKLKDNIENEIRWLYDCRNFNKQTIDIFIAGLRKAIKDATEDEEEVGEV